MSPVGMGDDLVVQRGTGLVDGFYRGIAPDAKVVLVKLARTGRITKRTSGRLDGYSRTGKSISIRIVNISAGGDYEQVIDRPLSQTVNAARPGIRFCAVGNAGHLPNHLYFRPQRAVSIAVGGLTTTFDERAREGCTARPTVQLRLLQKPEVIALRYGGRSYPA